MVPHSHHFILLYTLDLVPCVNSLKVGFEVLQSTTRITQYWSCFSLGPCYKPPFGSFHNRGLSARNLGFHNTSWSRFTIGLLYQRNTEVEQSYIWPKEFTIGFESKVWDHWDDAHVVLLSGQTFSRLDLENNYFTHFEEPNFKLGLILVFKSRVHEGYQVSWTKTLVSKYACWILLLGSRLKSSLRSVPSTRSSLSLSQTQQKLAGKTRHINTTSFFKLWIWI